MKAISEMTKKEKITLINKTVYEKIKRKVHRIVKDTTVYAELRKELYDAVTERVGFCKVQKDSKGCCHIAKTIPSDYRGIMATIQPKANGKSGLVVFFTLIMWPNSDGPSKPFIKNLKPRLTVNKSENGIQLLWFKDNKPLWKIQSCGDIAIYLRKDFAYCSYEIMEEVYSEISKIYSPKDFVPILKNMTPPWSANRHTIHGMDQRLFKRFSGGTNPRDLLNKIYGKSGQQSLSKNAFGGIANIKSFASLVIAADIVQMTKSFPTSFFDKLKLANYDIDISSRENYELNSGIKDMQYFFKYFNHLKIQNELIIQISNEHWYSGFPGYASDAGRMLRDICKHATASGQRDLWKNIKLFKGTIVETHDMIAIEHAKITHPEKILSYTKYQNMFLHEQKVTDNIISILPKKNHDLVLWGSTQNNCIGSYAERINGRGDFPNIIVGFMNTKTNSWVGHAQIVSRPDSIKEWSIVQLKGKNNCNLDKADETAIRGFLQNAFVSMGELSSVYEDLDQ